eukprot:COSAG01_NODE_1862_length_9038_cov_3.750755_6_plen_76_part_00
MSIQLGHSAGLSTVPGTTKDTEKGGSVTAETCLSECTTGSPGMASIVSPSAISVGSGLPFRRVSAPAQAFPSSIA